MAKQGEQAARWIEGMIRDFVATDPDNRMEPGTEEPIWDEPLVGFASGADPMFAQNKEHIGDFVWTPAEIMAEAHPGQEFRAEDLAVVAWILPQTRATREENAKQEVYPSRRWALARGPGEAFNERLRAKLVARLEEAGVAAVAPMLHPKWQRQDSPRYGYASRWSERHAAHAAGLGTFGLCDGLITPRGKAVRVGSLVARLELPASPRPYRDHHAYCLFFSQGTCQKCVPRCPVQALSSRGHDKIKCGRHVHSTSSAFVKQTYGLEADCCGLCQVEVPCSDHIPSPAEGL